MTFSSPLGKVNVNEVDTKATRERLGQHYSIYLSDLEVEGDSYNSFPGASKSNSKTCHMRNPRVISPFQLCVSER